MTTRRKTKPKKEEEERMTALSNDVTPILGHYSGELSEEEKELLRLNRPQWMNHTLLLQEILEEIKGLRKDLKQKRQLSPSNVDDMKNFLEQYVKTIRDIAPTILPNMGSNSTYGIPSSSSSSSSGVPEVNVNELRKHLAEYVKEMTKSEVLEHMPNNLKDTYMRLIQSIIKPNDPIFSEEVNPDPREPYHFIAEEVKKETDKYQRFKDLEKKYAELYLACTDCHEIIPNNELVIINKDENLHRKCFEARNRKIKNEL